MARKFTDKEIKEGCRVVVNDKCKQAPWFIGERGILSKYRLGNYGLYYGVKFLNYSVRWFYARELDKEEQDGKAES